MLVTVTPGRPPYEWKIDFDGRSSMSAAATAVLDGFEPHIGAIFGCAIALHPPHPATADDLIRAINEVFSVMNKRHESGEDLIFQLPENPSCADAEKTIADLFRGALCHLSFGIEALHREDIREAIQSFSAAIEMHTGGKIHFHILEEQLDQGEPSSGPRHALSFRRDQQLKPDYIEMCRTIIQTGREVRQLNDIRDFPEYRPEFWKLSDRTQKEWARTVGITLSPGRRKKNK